MKKASTYIPSVILSVLLVFCVIAGSALLIADLNVTASKTKTFSEKEDLAEKVHTDLDKYYRSKANATGIPASVYMDCLDKDYLNTVIGAYIDATYGALENDGRFSVEVPKNTALDNSIDTFFSDYADKTGYKKDENYEKKLASTKENAYKTIGSSCDIFKVNSMNSHGLLKKLSKLYRIRYKLTFVVIAATVLFIIILAVLHRKRIYELLYWCGISSLIAGIMGTIPSAYLIATKYYNAFSIKQPQVFAAYTKSLFGLTEAFMASQIAAIVIGIGMLVVYAVFCGKGKKASAVHSIGEEK